MPPRSVDPDSTTTNGNSSGAAAVDGRSGANIVVSHSGRFRLLFSWLASATLLFSLAGCWLSLDDSGGPALTKAVALNVSVSSTTASVGKPLVFRVAALTQNINVKAFRWNFSDGKSASGDEVTVSFAAVGRVDATVTADLDDGTTTSVQASVFVFDSTGAADPRLRLPAAIGDVDADATLSTLDALATAQTIYGTLPLSADRVHASDIDLDGRTTAKDLALVMQAVVKGARFPSAVLTPQIYPGSVLSIVSPTLFNPDSTLAVRVNGVSASTPVRVAMGYTAALSPTAIPASDTTATIELLVDGQVVETFSRPLMHVPSMPPDAAVDVQQFISDLKTVVSAQQAHITTLLNSSGVPSADQAAALASANAGVAMLDKAAKDLQTLFSSADGAPLAPVFQKALYANGLQEFRDSMASGPLASRTGRARAMAVSGDQVCDTLIPSVCGLKTAAELADDGSMIVSGACSAVAIAAFGSTFFDFPPAAAGAIAFFVDVCVPLNVAATFGSAVGTLFEPVDIKLQSAASPGPQGPDQTWSVTSSVSFLGLQETCGAGAGAATEALVDKILGERIVAVVMRSNAGLKLLSEVFAKYSDEALVALLEQIQDSVSDLLDVTGLGDAFSEVIGSVCPNISFGSTAVPVRRVFTTQPPADQGVLQYNADDTGTFFCPPPGPIFQTQTTLEGQLQLCQAQPAQTQVDISCATNEVTITMGDNGNLLDDIFEVVVDGRTVLTSNVPVRSTSVTLYLPRGQTTVVMRGLAAPDGVGTYFINFSGAAVVSGETSGTDLVPGTAKQFVVEVL